MKKIIYFLCLITLASCSVSKESYRPKKLTRKKMKELMKYSDWRYTIPNPSRGIGTMYSYHPEEK